MRNPAAKLPLCIGMRMISSDWRPAIAGVTLLDRGGAGTRWRFVRCSSANR